MYRARTRRCAPTSAFAAPARLGYHRGMPSKSHLARTLALVALVGACAEPERARPPNILFVSIDSLRYDHVGCYGYPFPTSPTIDRLAREGVRFQNALSSTSWTLPAHAAMFTGLSDSTHGLVDNGLRLDPKHRTLAEELSKAGYRTAGFYGGPYLHPVFGLGDGFDVYESCMTQVPDGLSDEQMRMESRRPDGKTHDDVTSPRTLEKVAKWAADAPRDKPYFLFVHLWDVHYDFIAPPEYVALFDPDYAGTLDGVNFMQNTSIRPKMDARDFRHLMALYDAEIRYTDDHLGRMLEALKERGLLENTVVVVTADHGEEFLDHGRKGHQHSLFEELVRVPLVVHWPGQIQAGATVDTQVRSIDLMPTLLAITGVRDVPAMAGRDLRPLLAGQTLPERPALMELHADGRQYAALRTNDYKTISWGLKPTGEPLPELSFDLSADPREQRPIYPKDSPRCVAGLAALKELRTHAVELRARIGTSAKSIDIDAEMAKRLGELGYLDTDPSSKPSDR